jgi:hypothetical protein
MSFFLHWFVGLALPLLLLRVLLRVRFATKCEQSRCADHLCFLSVCVLSCRTQEGLENILATGAQSLPVSSAPGGSGAGPLATNAFADYFLWHTLADNPEQRSGGLELIKPLQWHADKRVRGQATRILRFFRPSVSARSLREAAATVAIRRSDEATEG